MRRGVFLWILASIFLKVSTATSIGVYFNQADWAAAMSLQGTNPLTSISFDSSQWTDGMQASPLYTSLVSQSTGAASNGMTVSASSGYGAPGIADSSTLGHVSDGSWVDSVSKYGSTTFTFGQAIYGFGGHFDIAGGNGLYISVGGEVPYPYLSTDSLLSPYPSYDGFIGVISDQPMDNIVISWGDNGSCYKCFGNSYTLSDFEVATLPTPEPNFKYAFAGVLILALGYSAFRRSAS